MDRMLLTGASSSWLPGQVGQRISVGAHAQGHSTPPAAPVLEGLCISSLLGLQSPRSEGLLPVESPLFSHQWKGQAERVPFSE